MSTRRDLLRAALGVPAARLAAPFGLGAASAALGSCASRARVPDGELLDFGRARGHERIRDAGIPALNPAWPKKRTAVAIVGGGVAGLSAAWRLRRAGVDDVVLLELDDVVGGTAQSGASAVTKFPWGAHYVVLPYADNGAFTALLDEMGVLDGVDERGDPRAREEFGCREPEERHFREGEFQEGLYPKDGETDDERAQRERFTRELVSLAGFVDGDGRRAFTIPRARCSHAMLSLDTQSFAAWLDARAFTSWRLRWLCDYACRDDYGLSLAQTSAWAGLFYFCARRRDDGPDREVITWPEGNGAVVAHLARGVPSVLRAHAVVDVSPRAAARSGAASPAPTTESVDVLAFGDDGPLVIEADDVVVACPRHVAAHVVRPYREQKPAWLAHFTTSSWAVVNLHLRERPQTRGFPLAWDSVITDSPSLGYVTATHQRGVDHGPTVLTWYRPLVDEVPAHARETLLGLDRAAWADAALHDLEAAHPDIRDVVVRADVGRHGHAMVRPVPGLFTSDALASAQQSLGRVHFAHTDLSGVALCEEAFFHGVRAAEEILLRRDPTTRSIL